MKIGILTFHWATNYGAILQAFALQTYLKKMGHDVYIINFRPKKHKKTLLGCFSSHRFWNYLANVKEFIKERKLDVFRREYLNETLPYESLDELKSNPPKFDLYICGSDQIWNPSFTTRGEGKATSVYFLDCGNNDIKRIAYAVSFGCENYPEAASTIAKQYIGHFKAISVREDSGIHIVTKLGFLNPIKLPDPTLLLLRDEYNFANTVQVSSKKTAFVYILRGETKDVKGIKSYLEMNYKLDTTNELFNPYSVEEWVSSIKNASIVLTNSFHGMVFSLIFHVPFIVVLYKGSAAGMNDRLKSLLSYLNLEHRVIDDYDVDKLNVLVDDQINWQKVDDQLTRFRNETNTFFDQMLS